MSDSGSAGFQETVRKNVEIDAVTDGTDVADLGCASHLSAGLNILRGPRFVNWDTALFKNFRITERWFGTLKVSNRNCE